MIRGRQRIDGKHTGRIFALQIQMPGENDRNPFHFIPSVHLPEAQGDNPQRARRRGRAADAWVHGQGSWLEQALRGDIYGGAADSQAASI